MFSWPLWCRNIVWNIKNPWKINPLAVLFHKPFLNLGSYSATILKMRTLLPKSLIMILDIFVASTTTHPYITFTSVSVSPSPLVLPGCFTVGVQATVHHHFGRDVKVVLKIEKQLLGIWTQFPCAHGLGSWWDYTFLINPDTNRLTAVCLIPSSRFR